MESAWEKPHNVHPNNQLCTEKSSGYCASFVCSACYTALQVENSVRNFSAMNPDYSRKKYDKATGKPHHAIANQHLALSAKGTGIQRGTKMLATLLLRLAKRHVLR